jgi:short-subunit dehydrogenase
VSARICIDILILLFGGFSSGIGEGIARAYAKDKVSLVLLARNLGIVLERRHI